MPGARPTETERFESEGFYENPFASSCAKEDALNPAREREAQASFFKVGYSPSSVAFDKNLISTLKPRHLVFSEQEFSRLEVSPFVASREEDTTTVDLSRVRPS